MVTFCGFVKKRFLIQKAIGLLKISIIILKQSFYRNVEAKHMAN